MISTGELFWFGIKFSVAMLLAGVAIVLCIGIITAPLGMALFAFIGRWIGKSWIRIKSKEWAANELAGTKRTLEDTVAVPEEGFPWEV